MSGERAGPRRHMTAVERPPDLDRRARRARAGGRAAPADPASPARPPDAGPGRGAAGHGRLLRLAVEPVPEPANLSLIVQQVMIVGTLGDRPDDHHPDRGRRPVGRARSWSLVDRHGQAVGRGGLPGLAALPVGFARRAACGALNGVLITRLRLPPFIVTLGTLSIFFALEHLRVAQRRRSGAPTWTRCCWSTGETIECPRHERDLRLDRDARGCTWSWPTCCR